MWCGREVISLKKGGGGVWKPIIPCICLVNWVGYLFTKSDVYICFTLVCKLKLTLDPVLDSPVSSR